MNIKKYHAGCSITKVVHALLSPELWNSALAAYAASVTQSRTPRMTPEKMIISLILSLTILFVVSIYYKKLINSNIN